MNTLSFLIGSLALGLCVAAHASGSADNPAPPREDIERELHQAQERMDRTAREIADLTLRLDNQVRFDAKSLSGFAQQRAVLGLTIGMSGNEDEGNGGRRPPGVRVISVTPGGPADVSGLRANDVIVRFNGAELRDLQAPGRKLLVLIHDVKADAPVAVEFQRDGKPSKTTITPKSVSAFIGDSYFEGLKSLGEGLDSMAYSFATHGSIGFGSAEFLALTPGLGRYFGSDHGLLVVRAPKDERLKLLDGDVVLDIDGRVPSGVSHAFQILRSYRAGEVMKLHIMRQQRKLELPVEIPADTARWRPEPGAPAMPAPPPPPPAPPSPPAPPPSGSIEG